MTETMDLSKFQIDLLTVLVEDARAGMRAKEELEAQYGTSINHGRVYQNLDALQELGLVVKVQEGVDGRTHRYEPTEEGVVAARAYAQELWTRVRDKPETVQRALGGLDSG